MTIYSEILVFLVASSEMLRSAINFLTVRFLAQTAPQEVTHWIHIR